MHLRILILILIHIRIHTRIHTHIYTYICIYKCAHVHANVHPRIYACMCMRIYVDINVQQSSHRSAARQSPAHPTSRNRDVSPSLHICRRSEDIAVSLGSSHTALRSSFSRSPFSCSIHPSPHTSVHRRSESAPSGWQREDPDWQRSRTTQRAF